MQNQTMRATIIVILVSASFVALLAVTPGCENTMKTSGNLRPFCPEFIGWLKNPRMESGTAEGALHGLGLIPAPVSMVGMSRETVSGINKPGNSIFLTPAPTIRFFLSHPDLTSI
ncbi:MAG TPA: hypothetical protein VMS89_09585 [Methanoregulaceae archaeon]|nr:hypothetical protein [Methanoregulaceae archaeon]